MPLVKRGEVVDDPFVTALDEESIPQSGAVIVSLEQWKANREALIARGDPLGIRLSSSESPQQLADDVEHFAVVALEFPAFGDGRAYSYARLLRERCDYKGEVRAVGDVLFEQLHYMARCGFDAFEIDSENALDEWKAANADMSVWYQPTRDGRKTAMQQRRG